MHRFEHGPEDGGLVAILRQGSVDCPLGAAPLTAEHFPGGTVTQIQQTEQDIAELGDVKNSAISLGTAPELVTDLPRYCFLHGGCALPGARYVGHARRQPFYFLFIFLVFFAFIIIIFFVVVFLFVVFFLFVAFVPRREKTQPKLKQILRVAWKNPMRQREDEHTGRHPPRCVG